VDDYGQEILPPREAKALKKERVENFRRYARAFVLDNLQAVADEIMEHGTRSERASLLNWMAQNGYGLPSKTPIQVDDGGQSVDDILNEIGRKKALEQAQKDAKLLPEASGDATPT
jgi:hypothetical protein